MNIYGNIGLFIGGMLFSTFGFKALGSKEAKTFYTHATAAYLRCKEDVMKQVDILQENCSDILADAKALNEERAAEEEKEFIANTAEA